MNTLCCWCEPAFATFDGDGLAVLPTDGVLDSALLVAVYACTCTFPRLFRDPCTGISSAKEAVSASSSAGTTVVEQTRLPVARPPQRLGSHFDFPGLAWHASEAFGLGVWMCGTVLSDGLCCSEISTSLTQLSHKGPPDEPACRFCRE